MKIELAFGALAPSLAEQLDRRPTDVAMWQKDADAITRLLVRDLLAPAAGRAARKKLMRRIASATIARDLSHAATQAADAH